MRCRHALLHARRSGARMIPMPLSVWLFRKAQRLFIRFHAWGAHVSDCPNHTVGRITTVYDKRPCGAGGTFGYESGYYKKFPRKTGMRLNSRRSCITNTIRLSEKAITTESLPISRIICMTAGKLLPKTGVKRL